MESYVRAAGIDAMCSANAKVNRAARGAAYAVGAQVEIRDLPGYLPLEQNAALSDLFAANAARMPGLAVERGLPFCGSTDMGDLSWLMPVIQPTVSGFAGALHSRAFAAADENLAYLVPAKLMAATVIDLLAGGADRGKAIVSGTPRRSRRSTPRCGGRSWTGRTVFERSAGRRKEFPWYRLPCFAPLRCL